MTKKHILPILLISLSTTLFGQNYKTAIGFKGGYPYYGSIDVKHFFSGSNAGEFRLGGFRYDLFLQALYEKNYALGNVEGLEWYWGAGAHLGYWNYGMGAGYLYKKKYYDRTVYLGLDAVVGLEFTIPSVPLNFAFDIGPSFNLYPYFRPYVNSALAIRYAIQ